MYPNILKLLQILATLPVTTAEPECLFSKIKCTLIAIWSRMEESRLESLILIQIHQSETPNIDAVVDRFASTAARRLNFLL